MGNTADSLGEIKGNRTCSQFPKKEEKCPKGDPWEHGRVMADVQERGQEQKSQRQTYLRNQREKTVETARLVSLTPGDIRYIPGNLEGKKRDKTECGSKSGEVTPHIQILLGKVWVKTGLNGVTVSLGPM